MDKQTSLQHFLTSAVSVPVPVFADSVAVLVICFCLLHDVFKLFSII